MKTRALFLFHLFLLLLWQAPESHLVCTTIPHSLILSSQKVGNSNRRSRTITKLTVNASPSTSVSRNPRSNPH